MTIDHNSPDFSRAVLKVLVEHSDGLLNILVDAAQKNPAAIKELMYAHRDRLNCIPGPAGPAGIQGPPGKALSKKELRKVVRDQLIELGVWTPPSGKEKETQVTTDDLRELGMI